MASTLHPFQNDTEDRVGVIVLDVRRRLLVVEGESGKLSLPKGCRQLGETEWDGAMREAWEETGLDLESLPHVLYLAKLRLRFGTYFLFHLNLDGPRLPTQPQEGECKTVYWAAADAALFRQKPCNIDLSNTLRYLRSGSAARRRALCRLNGFRVDVRGAGLVRWGSVLKVIPRRPLRRSRRLAGYSSGA